MKNSLVIVFGILFVFISCNNDENIKIVKVKMTVDFPATIADKKPKIKTGTLTLNNINTGQKITHLFTSTTLPNLTVEDGIYTIQAIAQVSYITQDNSSNAQSYEVQREVRGILENVEIENGTFSTKLPLFFYNPSSTFLISEIFFSRTITPNKKTYDIDAFIEIYNNSNQTLYADGLCIAETFLQTVDMYKRMKPDFRTEKVAVKDVYRIPGSGKDHPVKQGETLLLCDIAINHKTNNPNSIDLSKANFEWFDSAESGDIDVPEVPNLEKIISTNTGNWNLNPKGNNSYLLFRLDKNTTPKKFLKNNTLNFKWLFSFGTTEMEMEENTWAIVNTQVIDAVECSTPSGFQWKVISPTLDLTWTHSGDADDKRYGHSVKRKISHKDGDRIVLQDTNDSASDFIATAPNPSPGEVTDHK